MQTPERPRIAGLILAGGRGERLGGAIKSELVVGGVRLLDRVAARFEGCDQLLVAHGGIAPDQLHLGKGMQPVPDLPTDYGGPLAGFAGSLSFLASEPNPPDLLVCAAVDAPFLPPDYVGRLVGALGSADAALAAYEGQLYPTNSAWRVQSFLDLPRQVLAGTAPRSLKSLAARANSVTLEWPAASGGDPFANINTPAELEEMQRRVAV